MRDSLRLSLFSRNHHPNIFPAIQITKVLNVPFSPLCCPILLSPKKKAVTFQTWCDRRRSTDMMWQTTQHRHDVTDDAAQTWCDRRRSTDISSYSFLLQQILDTRRNILLTYLIFSHIWYSHISDTCGLLMAALCSRNMQLLLICCIKSCVPTDCVFITAHSAANRRCHTSSSEFGTSQSHKLLRGILTKILRKTAHPKYRQYYYYSST